MSREKVTRRLPIGAEVQASGGVHFRVWAPRASKVEVLLERHGANSSGDKPHTAGTSSEEGGYFSALVAEASAGALYRFRLDGGDRSFPDPASRAQPQGCHGPSEVVDPHSYAWRDDNWKGVELPGQVIYEMHIGTFTQEGTWEAAARELPELARVGITMG